MRIAIVSTPFVPVPPPRYGGTELIVSELVRGLARAGHEVTLFATGDSRPPRGVALRAHFARAIWPPDPDVERAHAAWAVEQLSADRRGFDVIHTHVAATLPWAARLDAPLVCTVHHDGGVEHARRASLYRRHRAQLVAISTRQKQLIPELADARVIHHGLDPSRHPLGRGDGGYCAFLGRLSAEKGAHHAVDAARAAALPIRLAGAPHWRDRDYFARELSRRLALDGVAYLGEIGARRKRALLTGARALLFPIEWEEPFGLVMIEAMLSGTPVLAFPYGAAPEVIDPGVTGFLCRDVDELTRRLRALDGFDRRACRRRALERWTTARMVRDHEQVYTERQTWIGDVRAAETVA
jgi:glycosyltransferase involved in cell wall biosynthesis